jgi:predicted acylesterase/phospholipase RssA
MRSKGTSRIVTRGLQRVNCSDQCVKKQSMLGRQAVLFVAMMVLALVPLQGQDAQTRRPVVGIALSGGGALGIAHIGVLRYLEEHRIPVDRIAGTSMGALLGGLYATGHNAADLERIIMEADWDDLLRAAPKFEDRSVAEKEEWNRITGQYAIQLAKGLPRCQSERCGIPADFWFLV